MCEHCSCEMALAKPLPASKGTVDCDLCEVSVKGTARFEVSEYSFQRHLCEAHMKELRQDLDDGLAEMWKESGLQEATDFLPIKQAAPCGFLTPEEARKEQGQPCGGPAQFAELGVSLTPMCPKHAKESGGLDRES